VTTFQYDDSMAAKWRRMCGMRPYSVRNCMR